MLWQISPPSPRYNQSNEPIILIYVFVKMSSNLSPSVIFSRITKISEEYQKMFRFYITLLALRAIYIINAYLVVAVKNRDSYRVLVWCTGKFNENTLLILLRAAKEVVIISSDSEAVSPVKVGCSIRWEMLTLFCICTERQTQQSLLFHLQYV